MNCPELSEAFLKPVDPTRHRAGLAGGPSPAGGWRWVIPLQRKSFCLLLAAIMIGTVGQAAIARADDLPQLNQQAFQQAVAAAEPSIVRIETVGGTDLVGDLLTGAGPTTGVVVREDGYIITSRFNFIANPASILVTLPDGEKLAAEVVSQDHSKMLTLLKVPRSGLTPLTAVPNEEIRVGQWSIALGRTFDLKFPNVSVGIVSAVNRIWGKAIQTDAKTSPVNYGGALVDLRGRCLGIIVPLSPQETGEAAGVEWYDSGIGFAVPLADIQLVLDRMLGGESLHRGLLGVSFVDKGPISEEAKIVRVRPESPADRGGLKVDDVIVAIDGRPVPKLNDLKHVLGRMYAGQTVALAVRRGEESLNVQVTLTDELKAYEFPTLGIAPGRRAAGDETEGVVVRHVFQGSPAERGGLKPGDIVIELAAQPVTSAAELAQLASRRELGKPVELTVLRDGARRTLSLEPSVFPDPPPDDLPAAPIPAPKQKPEAATGRFNQLLPNSEQNFWMFVPERYNPEHHYGLLVWLHPAGDTMEAEMLRLLSDTCKERGVILLAPRAGDVSGFSPDQEEIVKDCVDWARERYRIDPRRVAVMGLEDSGIFATRLAFKYRDVFRGLIGLSTVLRVPPPDNDPEFRLHILLTAAPSSPQRALIEKSVEALRTRKFPAHLLDIPDETGGALPEEAVQALARWLDALDRI